MHDHQHSISEFAQFIAISFASGGLAYRLSSAAIRALRKPTPQSSALYAWFYDFTQYLWDNRDLKGQREEVQTSAKSTGA